MASDSDDEVTEITLYDAGLTSLEELEGFARYTHLEYLNLHSNALQRIEMLVHLVYLKELNLSSNQIQRMEGLDALVNLEILDLSSNLITRIEGVAALTSMRSLLLAYNKISDIAELTTIHGPSYHLDHLDLRGNRLAAPEQLQFLQGCVHLQELMLADSLAVGKDTPALALNVQRPRSNDGLIHACAMIVPEGGRLPPYISICFGTIPSLVCVDGMGIKGQAVEPRPIAHPTLGMYASYLKPAPDGEGTGAEGGGEFAGSRHTDGGAHDDSMDMGASPKPGRATEEDAVTAGTAERPGVIDAQPQPQLQPQSVPDREGVEPAPVTASPGGMEMASASSSSLDPVEGEGEGEGGGAAEDVAGDEPTPSQSPQPQRTAKRPARRKARAKHKARASEPGQGQAGTRRVVKATPRIDALLSKRRAAGQGQAHAQPQPQEGSEAVGDHAALSGPGMSQQGVGAKTTASTAADRSESASTLPAAATAGPVTLAGKDRAPAPAPTPQLPGEDQLDALHNEVRMEALESRVARMMLAQTREQAGRGIGGAASVHAPALSPGAAGPGRSRQVSGTHGLPGPPPSNFQDVGGPVSASTHAPPQGLTQTTMSVVTKTVQLSAEHVSVNVTRAPGEKNREGQDEGDDEGEGREGAGSKAAESGTTRDETSAATAVVEGNAKAEDEGEAELKSAPAAKPPRYAKHKGSKRRGKGKARGTESSSDVLSAAHHDVHADAHQIAPWAHGDDTDQVDKADGLLADADVTHPNPNADAPSVPAAPQSRSLQSQASGGEPGPGSGDIPAPSGSLPPTEDHDHAQGGHRDGHDAIEDDNAAHDADELAEQAVLDAAAAIPPLMTTESALAQQLTDTLQSELSQALARLAAAEETVRREQERSSALAEQAATLEQQAQALTDAEAEKQLWKAKAHELEQASEAWGKEKVALEAARDQQARDQREQTMALDALKDELKDARRTAQEHQRAHDRLQTRCEMLESQHTETRQLAKEQREEAIDAERQRSERMRNEEVTRLKRRHEDTMDDLRISHAKELESAQRDNKRQAASALEQERAEAAACLNDVEAAFRQTLRTERANVAKLQRAFEQASNESARLKRAHKAVLEREGQATSLAEEMAKVVKSQQGKLLGLEAKLEEQNKLALARDEQLAAVEQEAEGRHEREQALREALQDMKDALDKEKERGEHMEHMILHLRQAHSRQQQQPYDHPDTSRTRSSVSMRARGAAGRAQAQAQRRAGRPPLPPRGTAPAPVWQDEGEGEGDEHGYGSPDEGEGLQLDQSFGDDQPQGQGQTHEHDEDNPTPPASPDIRHQVSVSDSEDDMDEGTGVGHDDSDSNASPGSGGGPGRILPIDDDDAAFMLEGALDRQQDQDQDQDEDGDAPAHGDYPSESESEGEAGDERRPPPPAMSLDDPHAADQTDHDRAHDDGESGTAAETTSPSDDEGGIHHQPRGKTHAGAEGSEPAPTHTGTTASKSMGGMLPEEIIRVKDALLADKEDTIQSLKRECADVRQSLRTLQHDMRDIEAAYRSQLARLSQQGQGQGQGQGHSHAHGHGHGGASGRGSSESASGAAAGSAAQLEQARQRALAMQDRINGLEEALKGSKATVATQTQLIEHLETLVKTLKEEKKKLMAANQEAEAEWTAQQRRAAELTEAKERTLQERLDQAEAACAVADEDSQRIQDHVAKLEGMLGTLTDECTAAKHEAEMQRQRVAEVEDEMRAVIMATDKRTRQNQARMHQMGLAVRQLFQAATMSPSEDFPGGPSGVGTGLGAGLDSAAAALFGPGMGLGVGMGMGMGMGMGLPEGLDGYRSDNGRSYEQVLRHRQSQAQPQAQPPSVRSWHGQTASAGHGLSQVSVDAMNGRASESVVGLDAAQPSVGRPQPQYTRGGQGSASVQSQTRGTQSLTQRPPPAQPSASSSRQVRSGASQAKAQGQGQMRFGTRYQGAPAGIGYGDSSFERGQEQGQRSSAPIPAATSSSALPGDPVTDDGAG